MRETKRELAIVKVKKTGRFAAMIKDKKTQGAIGCSRCENLAVTLHPSEARGVKPSDMGVWRCSSCGAFRSPCNRLDRGINNLFMKYLIGEIRRSGRLNRKGKEFLEEQVINVRKNRAIEATQQVLIRLALKIGIELPNAVDFVAGDVLLALQRNRVATS